MMAQPVPPPLPPKTRRAPPESTTVLAKTVVSSSREESLVCSIPEVTNHVVKIRINPDQLNEDSSNNIGCIRISVNSEEMISTDKNYFFYSNDMTSGQVSPSDTLDSGTCSDLDGTPPPLPKKKSAVSVTLIGQHKLSTQELDSDNDSNLSCDSLNSSELQAKQASAYLPQGLLKDIRNRSTKLTQSPETIPHEPIEEPLDEQQLEKPLDKSHKQRHYAETQYEEQKTVLTSSPKVRIDENSYQMRKVQQKEETDKLALEKMLFDTDKFYNFHLNEKTEENHQDKGVTKSFDDETFAGYKDLLGSEGMKTIRSAKGTVRGVKNRVRAGIATFLQINSTTKNYKDKDMGKVVVYTTTMGIVRETYNACMKVKQILRTLLIKYEERDVFMSGDYQGEIRDRMRSEYILVPQVFVDGQHIGDAETIERLNETGELRRILKPFKSLDVCSTCQVCGGYRLLPCPVCNGSKKSVHRNHFTTEFVALKCMNCDEVGLVKCNSC